MPLVVFTGKCPECFPGIFHVYHVSFSTPRIRHSQLYQNRTVPVSETNSFVYNSLVVYCKSYIYKLACIGSIPSRTVMMAIDNALINNKQ
jgi:hypothetical protein